ncbi:MAG: hypothetical protein CM1200mP2_58310 [Planctomycetaceae bacterium]|nr:MAG: hypothetical protein CM1200mP2_58310 [Planctomycetaceae bacterium]
MNRDISSVPVVVELDSVPDVLVALESVADLPDVVLLESRIDREEVSRFSFLVADPVAFVDDVESVTGADPFGRLRGLLDPFRNDRVAGLPPFQGGVVGLLGYELGAAWETVPRPAYDEFALPVLAAGVYDRVLAWDHVLGRAWIISQGFPETDLRGRRQRAEQRAAELLSRLEASGQSVGAAEEPPPSSLEPEQLAPLWPVEGHDGLFSDFSREAYLEASTV